MAGISVYNAVDLGSPVRAAHAGSRPGNELRTPINTACVTRVACATHRQAPGMTGDDRLAADVLESRGISVSPAVWDDTRDWSEFAAVVIRSTWDYHGKLGAYVDWLHHLAAVGARDAVARTGRSVHCDSDRRRLTAPVRASGRASSERGVFC